MATFTLSVGCANTDTIYKVTTDTASTCLDFLRRYDDDDAVIRLFITDEDTWYDGAYENADVYPALHEWIAKQTQTHGETHGWGV